MPDYFVTFTAHVDERKRPENFPREVHVQETFKEVQSQEQLKLMVNKRFVDLISQVGLIAFKDESIPIDSRLTFDQRMFVPWHMLTHMHVDVDMIMEEPKSIPHDDISSGEPTPEPTTDVRVH